jgi:nitrous oxide reductase accessory protein NosL
MKFRSLMLLVLAALLLAGCAETKTTGYQSPDPMVDLANTCAMCGGSVDSNYLFNTGMRSIGPGNY